MTLPKVRTMLRHIIKTVIDENDPFPVEMLTGVIREGRDERQLLLARYHISRTAEIVVNVQYGLRADAKQEQEIRIRLDEKLQTRRSKPISIDWVVDTIFAAHLLDSPEFREPRTDPTWLGACGVAGLKQLIRDILFEDRDLADFQSVYLVSRGGEDWLVPRDQLTHEEAEFILGTRPRPIESYDHITTQRS